MKIFSASQIKAWDAYTIANEPVSSIDLMERAALQCVNWLFTKQLHKNPFKIFCGKGNNGGDGLAIARMLTKRGVKAEVYILEFGRKGTEDFQMNLQRLHDLPVPLHYIQTPENFPKLEETEVIIDALFGSGLSKPPEGLTHNLIQHINQFPGKIISIDVPSGLFLDQTSLGNTIVKAHYTLTFQTYKLALLIPENAPYTGEVAVLDIGLHPQFTVENETQQQLIDEAYIRSFFKKRQRFAHKGTYGHALIIGGSYGKMGAVVLAANACLRTGAGLTTAFIPRCGYQIMQTSLPEVMALTDTEEDNISILPGDISKYSAIGIGPGLGTAQETKEALFNLIKLFQNPFVIDADALNCLASQPETLSFLPSKTILTPHPKEFERLFGRSENNFEEIEKAQQKAQELGIIIILKGHHTLIALPDGRLYFNSTGNAGMAKGGSGDVLTGIITALLSQGYIPERAAILGVYIHGLAGDKAAKAKSIEAMTATDLVNFLPDVFLELNV